MTTAAAQGPIPMPIANGEKIPIDLLAVSPNNVRTDVDTSVEEFETLKTLIEADGGVRDAGYAQFDEKTGKFMLFAGQRRFLACKALGIISMPCDVYAGLTDSQMQQLSYQENRARLPMTKCDVVTACKRAFDAAGGNINVVLRMEGLDGSKIKTATTAWQYVRAATLPIEVRRMIGNKHHGKLSLGAADHLSKLVGRKQFDLVVRNVIAHTKKLTIAEVEEIVKLILAYGDCEDGSLDTLYTDTKSARDTLFKRKRAADTAAKAAAEAAAEAAAQAVVPPKVEPLKVELPVEPPKVELPVELSKVAPSRFANLTKKAAPTEPPKIEPPKIEPPKTEPPKIEPPKTEPPKIERLADPDEEYFICGKGARYAIPREFYAMFLAMLSMANKQATPCAAQETELH